MLQPCETNFTNWILSCRLFQCHSWFWTGLKGALFYKSNWNQNFIASAIEFCKNESLLVSMGSATTSVICCTVPLLVCSLWWEHITYRSITEIGFSRCFLLVCTCCFLSDFAQRSFFKNIIKNDSLAKTDVMCFNVAWCALALRSFRY